MRIILRLTGALLVIGLHVGAANNVGAARHQRLVERVAQVFVRNSDSVIATSTTNNPTSSPGGTAPALSASSVGLSYSTSATATSSSATTQTYVPPFVRLPAVKANPQITSPAYIHLTHLLPNVMQRAVTSSVHSWEIGTLCNALAELYFPSVSPFAYLDSSTPSGEEPTAILQVVVASLFDYDWTFSPSSLGANTPDDLSVYTSEETSPVPLKSMPLSQNDQALGDPVAIGTAAWITAQLIEKVSTPIDGARCGADYAWAVGNQLVHLRAGVTSSNGTISQREGYFQLWSDMSYMIPPALAYLGLSAHDDSLMQFGLDQWILEKSALFDKEQNLWRHINQQDNGFWATGNGWALLGLMRLIALFEDQGKTPHELHRAQEDAGAIFHSLFKQLDSDSLLPNYMLQDNATLAVGDVAGTAAVVAAYYRFYTLCPEHTTDALSNSADAAFTGVLSYVGDDGWAAHVVDPLGTHGLVVYPDDPTLHSPEAQSFIGMMWAARTVAGI